MSLHHELFLMRFGLDRVPLQSPMSVATMVHAAGPGRAPLDTLDDFLAAAAACKDMDGQLAKPLELTTAEYHHLRFLVAPQMRERPGLRDRRFDGVPIVLKD